MSKVSCICPICSWVGDHFLDWDQGSYVCKNHICERCGSGPKHRRAKLSLEGIFDKLPIRRVLHIGANAPENWLPHICQEKSIEYISVDIVPGPGQVYANVETLCDHVEEGSFGFIYASHVLEHVNDDHKALNSIAHALAPLGYALLDVPLDFSTMETHEDPALSSRERLKRYGDSGHKRQYGISFVSYTESITSLKAMRQSKKGDTRHGILAPFLPLSDWDIDLLRSMGLEDHMQNTALLFRKEVDKISRMRDKKNRIRSRSWESKKVVTVMPKIRHHSSYDLNKEPHRKETSEVFKEFLLERTGSSRPPNGYWPIAIYHIAGRRVFFIVDWDDVKFHSILPYMDKEDILILSRAWFYLDGLNDLYVDTLKLLEETPAGPALENVIIACNYSEEVMFFRSKGINAELINHNAFLDANLFHPGDGMKNIDAVHNAKLQPYKRHELMGAVRRHRVALLSDKTDEGYLQSIGGIPACYENLTPGERMTPKGVSEVLQRSRVGIILSEIEGACFASGEYLYTGIPVLSCIPTHASGSLGGREAFYDEYNSLLVAPNPESVAEGLEVLLNRKVDPYYIRENALNYSSMIQDKMDSILEGKVGPCNLSDLPYKGNKQLWKISSIEPIVRFIQLKHNMFNHSDWV